MSLSVLGVSEGPRWLSSAWTLPQRRACVSLADCGQVELDASSLLLRHRRSCAHHLHCSVSCCTLGPALLTNRPHPDLSLSVHPPPNR